MLAVQPRPGTKWHQRPYISWYLVGSAAGPACISFEHAAHTPTSICVQKSNKCKLKTNVDGHAPEFRHFGDRDAAASCDVVLCSDRCSGFRPGLRVWVVPDSPTPSVCSPQTASSGMQEAASRAMAQCERCERKSKKSQGKAFERALRAL